MSANESDAVAELLEAAKAVGDFGTNNYFQTNDHGARLRNAVDQYLITIGEAPYFGDTHDH
jgi:hypothetical protein